MQLVHSVFVPQAGVWGLFIVGGSPVRIRGRGSMEIVRGVDKA